MISNGSMEIERAMNIKRHKETINYCRLYKIRFCRG